MPTTIEVRETNMTGVMEAVAGDQARAIVQTAHARVTARIAILRNAIDAALMAFGCTGRTDQYTFSAYGKAVLAQLHATDPNTGWPNSFWANEEEAVLAALDDANRGYAIVEQSPVTDDLPDEP